MFNNWEDLEKAINSELEHVIFDCGNRNADVMFIGDFPSNEDIIKGIPFSGKQGQILDKAFAGLGINKEKVYITNLFKTIQNENPSAEIINNNMNYLRNQVILLKPKIIVLMGKIVVSNILGKEYEGVNSEFVNKKDILYMPTYSVYDIYKKKKKKINFWLDLKSVISKCKESNFNI